MDIIQKILNKVEEEYKQEAKKPVTKGVYRASEVGNCPKAIQYKILGYKAEEVTPETLLIFRDGHVHHNDVRDLFSKIGHVTNVEMSCSKRYNHNGEKFLITGTVDFVFNGSMVIDIKSMSTFRFKTIEKKFPDDFMSYIEQVHLYMDILSLPKGAILFKDKNSAELKIKEFKYSYDVIKDILDRLANLHKLAKKKELVPRPYERNSWQCRLCPYRLSCYNLPMEARHWR
jgi:CRISPR/Cas system-associated exonuclease Cas4 (RecB family)